MLLQTAATTTVLPFTHLTIRDECGEPAKILSLLSSQLAMAELFSLLPFLGVLRTDYLLRRR